MVEFVIYPGLYKMPAVGKQVLVIGGGGREHAICWKLSQSPLISKVYALPGSHGIGQVVKCENVINVSDKDFQVSCKRSNCSAFVKVLSHHLSVQFLSAG